MTTSAQYPIGWIHRRRRRLPAVDTGSSAEVMRPSPPTRSPETPGRCGVRLELHRDVAAATRSPPTLPDKRLRVPSERSACRLVSQRNTIDSWRCTTETPKGLPGARNLARITAEDVQPRRGLSAHRRCCHPRCGTACKPLHDGTELARFTNRASRSSPSPFTSFTQRPRRKRRHQPPRVRPQTGHDRSPT